ncbi:MAG: YdcF family protein, partial [Candidatus Omnitrophica bacterium]|nr:YdcF family protein [Candidatus Omnitrophota bacterium]
MRGFFIAPQKNKFYRCLSGLIVCAVSFSLIFSPSAVQAQSILNLPVPGTMIHLSPAFAPVLLKGMTIHPNDPLKFDFIIDSGNTYFTIDEIKKETERLVKYFLASMTVPKDDLWVNLSPYENDRIIPDELGKTELGRDMLAQDYILKQLTASLMYPEKELGEKFWDKVYQKAEEQFGTSEIPVNTFNKVWILPENATVYEHEQTVYVVDAKLKVMLDSDYLAMDFHQKSTDRSRGSLQDDTSEMSESIIREIIIPEIEREVNEGEHFATLRQIYHSLILAKWYKETIKNSLLSQVYVDQNKIAGVDVDDKTIKDQIYARYMEAYKKGVFNYIKEDYDRLSQKIIPRKYFSGGLLIGAGDIHRTSSPVNESKNPKYRASVEVAPQKLGQSSSPVEPGKDAPMPAEDFDRLIREYKNLYFARKIIAFDVRIRGGIEESSEAILLNEIRSRQKKLSGQLDGVSSRSDGLFVMGGQYKDMGSLFMWSKKIFNKEVAIPRAVARIFEVNDTGVVIKYSMSENPKQFFEDLDILEKARTSWDRKFEQVLDGLTLQPDGRYNTEEVIAKISSLVNELNQEDFLVKINKPGIWEQVKYVFNILQTIKEKEEIDKIPSILTLDDVALKKDADWLTNGEGTSRDSSSEGQSSSPIVQSMLNVLRWRDEFNVRTIRDIIILGNYNLETFREALRVHRESGKKSRMVITGGRGRFIETTIAVAEKYGVDFTDIDKESVSEAELIDKVIIKMVQEEEEFSDLHVDLIDIRLESSSSDTPQNIQFYRRDILEKDNNRPLEQGEYNVLFIQTPHQQLRSKATFDKIFTEKNITGFSHTVNYNIDGRSRYDIVKDMLEEAWRLLLYSQERGNGTINLHAIFRSGADGIPTNFWQNALNLFGELDLGEQYQLAQNLKIMMEKTTKDDKPLSFGDLMSSTQKNNPIIDKFVQTIKEEAASSDSSIGKASSSLVEVEMADIDIPGQPVVRLKEHYTPEELAAVERSLKEYQRLAGGVEALLTRPEGFMEAFDSLKEWNRDMEFDKEKPASKLKELIQIYEKFDNAYTEVEDEFEEILENAREGLVEFNENGDVIVAEINAVMHGFNDKFKKIIEIVSVIVTFAGLKEDDISAEDLNKYYKNALQIEHKIKKYLQFIRHLNDPSGITPDSIKDNREEKSVPTYPYIFFLIPYKKLMMGESDQNRKDADASSPIISVEGRTFSPELDFEQGRALTPVDIQFIRNRVTRNTQHVRHLLEDAEKRNIELTISGHLRGVDGPGSSLDLPEFQKALTTIGASSFDDLPSTPTIASAFTATVKFEKADNPNEVVYVAPDYGITEKRPLRFTSDVILHNGRTPKGQADAPGYILRNLFGLSGVKITMKGISPMALAGGMESSNVFNTALIAAASMLSGVDLSQAEI